MTAEWAMVWITAVYVIATCAICYFNYQSTKATKAQLTEMQRQFYAANRPIVTVEVIYERRLVWGLRFSNRGNQTAFNTEIELNDDFIHSLPDKEFRDLVRANNGKVRTIGVGQHHDIYFAGNNYRALREKPAVYGKIRYRGNDSSLYVEDFCIEMQDYAVFFSINSETEELIKKIDDQTSVLRHIQSSMETIAENSRKGDHLDA